MRTVGPYPVRDQVPTQVCPSSTFSCARMQHTFTSNIVRSPPTSRCAQFTPMMRTQYGCVCFFLPSLHVRNLRHMTEPPPHAGTSRRSSSPPRRMSKIPSSSPHPPSLPFPAGATETGIRTHSTSFPSRRLLIPHRHHPRRSVRKSKIRTTIHDARPCTVPPARHAKVRLRANKATTTQARSPFIGRGKDTRSNSGSNELMHALQNAFATGTDLTARMRVQGRGRRGGRRSRRRRSW